MLRNIICAALASWVFKKDSTVVKTFLSNEHSCRPQIEHETWLITFFYAVCESLKWVIYCTYRSVNWKLKVNRWTHTQPDAVTEKVFMLKWGVPQCKIVFKYSEWARRSLMTPPVPFWTNSSTHSGFIVVCQPTAICATLNQLACH